MTSDADRPRYRPLFPIPAAVLIAVSLLVLMLLLIDGPAPSTPAVEHLPHTDGAERLAPLSVSDALRLERFQAAQRACDGPCVTDFGTPLGRADGVEARSNCVSLCVRLESSFVDPDSGRIQIGRSGERPEHLEYAGLAYQCVEYARRWWIQTLGLTFGDVPTAADILSLTEGRRLSDQAVIPLGRSLNGHARRAPERGDLLIYAADPGDPEWRAGHVAVVVDTDLEQGWVALAEQNYDNRPWSDPERQARRIQIRRIGERYRLLDVAPDQIDNPEGGSIAGWIYPRPELMTAR
ncbi:CHAP domain-containing protein [Allochromatium palmeri]|uniref:CHAP domain-containing protein n=1 Tax=Allochromatium palmeri TaxID=231048 RepID=A0A6N8EFX5_9GAMM|nr:CHAP domain-containing protein [Allochromatium palmeri]MTW23123.1 CHAP domain-containing protein [Allochromatium palmeri]